MAISSRIIYKLVPSTEMSPQFLPTHIFQQGRWGDKKKLHGDSIDCTFTLNSRSSARSSGETL